MKSTFFHLVTVVTGIVGLIGGIVSGNVFKIVNIEQNSSILRSTPKTTETFNAFLMIEVWVAFALLALAFYAISCHLSYQEATLMELQSLKISLKESKSQETIS